MRVASLQTRWRYLVPVAALGVIALVTTGVFRADATPSLPGRTAAQLLAAVEKTQLTGFSGTVVQKSSLGLAAALPAATTASGPSMAALLTGTNTIKVWYGAADQQRIALLDPVGETDVFRNGSTVWQWQSATRTATLLQVPRERSGSSAPADPSTATPDDVARAALSAISPSTTVRTDSTSSVAGRSVYRLVLQPKDDASRIRSVVLSLDGETKVPLAAQVFARGAGNSPAVDVSFTHVDFAAPDPANFTFRLPSNAHQQVFDSGPTAGQTTNAEPLLGAVATRTVGSGWTRVVVITPPDPGASATTTARQLGSAAKTVSGAWGSGRLLESSLLCALFLDDGRILVGAVGPDALYAAARTS